VLDKGEERCWGLGRPQKAAMWVAFCSRPWEGNDIATQPPTSQLTHRYLDRSEGRNRVRDLLQPSQVAKS
jgi:hypothetical protein